MSNFGDKEQREHDSTAREHVNQPNAHHEGRMDSEKAVG